MFWDRVAWVYDVFAKGINRKANQRMCAVVGELISPMDEVLECACGTGLLSGVIAPRCRRLVATDFSEKMLKRAKKKGKQWKNARFEQADLLHLSYPDQRFDVVVAANVIHLLDEPYRALRELDRVCRRVVRSSSPPISTRPTRAPPTASPTPSARRVRISNGRSPGTAIRSSLPTPAMRT